MQDSSHTPLHLAEANDIPSFAIDPSLGASSEFFPNPVVDLDHAHDQDEDHQNGNEVLKQAIQNNGITTEGRLEEGDEEPTQEDIDAVIKASLDHAQAAAAASDSLLEIDPALVSTSTENNNQAIPDTSTERQVSEGRDNQDGESSNKKQKFNSNDGNVSSDQLGQEHNPIQNPPLHIAPFSKPSRDLENTPLPLFLTFQSKKDFLRWLDAESSWCHFVQRRTTTPDKRSAERLQSRIRAHTKSLEAMTPEERAAMPPLKTRKRKRVSPVFEKVTFTCHHAGTYESRHSAVLPKEKLRLNTKKSVKCACASRVVLSELQSGDCKVVYHWKHEGHDPFADNDLEGGRLPKSIDIWLNKQIEVGHNLDDIRKVLSIPDEEKEAYLAKVAADPTSLDPDMPPPLALALKVKYPDIYNRYRKLKGPVKDHKQLKGTTKKSSKSNSSRDLINYAETNPSDPLSDPGSGSGTQSPSVSVSLPVMGGIDDTEHTHEQIIGFDQNGKPSYSQDHSSSTIHEDGSSGVGVGVGDISLDPLIESSLNHSSISGPSQHQHQEGGIMIDEHSEVDTEFAQLASSHDLVNIHQGNADQHQEQDNSQQNEIDLINSHEGLARALLQLPSAGLRDEEGNEMSLEEAMRRMAEGVAAVAAATDDHEEVEVDINGGIEEANEEVKEHVKLDL